MSDNLLDALEARRGIVCAVGAGGKKSTLYRLAQLHTGRVALTSTVHIPPVPKDLNAHIIVMAQEHLPAAVLEAASTYRRLAYFQPSEKRGRFAGVASELIVAIHNRARFDATLVKADGARTRLIKAPDETEPRIPDEADVVLALVSARALGEPLDSRIAHRVGLVTAATGAAEGEPLRPIHLARLLASEKGSLKGVGRARVIPVVNMVDDPQREKLAREIAEHALHLASRFDRVVLTSMHRNDLVVRVIWRKSEKGIGTSF